jgi:hypothetical protein
LGLAFSGTQPQLNHQGIDGKADPKSDPEELVGLEISQTAGSKETRRRTTATEIAMHAQNPARNQREEGRLARDSRISSRVCRSVKHSIPVAVKSSSHLTLHYVNLIFLAKL